MDWHSRGDLLSRERIRMSLVMCRGVFDRLSIGELSLFDSVLESGRKTPINQKAITVNTKKKLRAQCAAHTHTHIHHVN